MPSTGLDGPYSLTTDEVSSLIEEGKTGSYALSATESGTFTIHYVGRSDEDLRAGNNILDTAKPP